MPIDQHTAPRPSDPAPQPATADPIAKLHLDAGHCAVVGLQWGDEGKGQIVDMLAPLFDLITRFNGGNNAGHSVLIGDQKFALHLVPSGILYGDKINVIGNGVVVNPQGLLGEIDGLRARGVKIAQNLRISSRAHVVMPYHRTEDQLYAQVTAAVSSGAEDIGTTGRGIGPCYADKAQRTTAVRVGDLLRPDDLQPQIRRAVSIKNAILGALAQLAQQPFTPFDADQVLAEALAFGQRLEPHITDTTHLLQEAIESKKRILFEGANAALLDIDHGTYPFVTSSTTSALGVYTGAGVPNGTLGNVIGVAKAYTSRVGGGPHPTELKDALGERIRTAGQEYGTTTGRPRRVGWLDLMAVRYSARLNGATGLVVTGLAVLAGIETLRVCVGYKLGGQMLDAYPADGLLLARIEPVYEELPGFAQALGDCRSFGELPPAARAYIERIERFVGVPVKLVCVGRKRDQVLAR
ncbi:MAG: adenylosuccinate synthase [Phycisphaeraceae bacterium]